MMLLLKLRRVHRANVMTRQAHLTIEPRISKLLLPLKYVLKTVADYPKQHRHINKLKKRRKTRVEPSPLTTIEPFGLIGLMMIAIARTRVTKC